MAATPATPPDTKTLLLRWREAHGVSVRELAALTGVSISQISRYERGLRKPPALTRLQIARRLGVKVDEIFSVENERLS